LLDRRRFEFPSPPWGKDVGDDKSGNSGNALRAVGELGPAWITAITGLVATLTTAGFIVGHATAGSSAAPQPAVTITKTIQVGAGAAVNPAPSATAAEHRHHRSGRAGLRAADGRP
jgi:hypothetical protein